MNATATIESTGEVLSYPANSPEEIVESLKLVYDYEKAVALVKNKLKRMAEKIVDANGQYEHNGYLLRVSNVQPMTYDKGILREVFDEDTLDLFMKPQKTEIDKFIAEHLEELGANSTRLRQAMIPAGKPYQTVRLERLTRE